MVFHKAHHLQPKVLRIFFTLLGDFLKEKIKIFINLYVFFIFLLPHKFQGYNDIKILPRPPLKTKDMFFIFIYYLYIFFLLREGIKGGCTN